MQMALSVQLLLAKMLHPYPACAIGVRRIGYLEYGKSLT